MRFNPDYEPDPDLSREKFQTLETLDDLPEEASSQLEDIRERVVEMLKHEEDTKDRDSLVTYFAFQEFQIHALQSEIANIHKMLILLARAVDNGE
jgi:hypothetical protein